MAGSNLIDVAAPLVARVEALGEALRARHWQFATAESCTGGLLAGACTAPAGASDWFAAGFVSYANAAKEDLLGVPAALIERHGAVSAEVAAAMARGALARGRAQLAVAVTGIAGPGGGSPDKPVGTVWLGLAWIRPAAHARAAVEMAVITECLHLAGDRAAIRAQTVDIALDRALARALDVDGAPANAAPVSPATPGSAG